MKITYAPMDWTGPRRSWETRPYARFRAGWNDTLKLLEREIDNIEGSNVVWQMDYTRGQIRQDGMPRADAKIGEFPGVRILFDTPGGQLVFATDMYDDWKDNVRAIALALEALRAVDRYGVTSGTEQYKGFLQLEGGPAVAPATRMDSRQAAEFIARAADPVGGGREPIVRAVLDDAMYRASCIRAASKALHPDRGGSVEQFQQLQQAKEVLNA